LGKSKLRAKGHLVAGLLAVGLFVGGCLCLASASHRNTGWKSQTYADHARLFSQDPQDISNRLYRQVHVRKAKNGKEYGLDELDPLLWSQTKYLLTGPSHTQLLGLLDEFTRIPPEQQLADPLKKAILARELWAVFDWAAPLPNHDYNWTQDRSRRQLASRLARAIRQLALTQTEIAALPRTYQRAIEDKEFPAKYDPADPNRPFLPPDLFDPGGTWVCIGINGQDRIAPTHELTFSRSAFFVFMRLPGGRQATLDYLKQIAHFDGALKLPGGVEFALARQLILPDVQRNLVLTPIIESIQIRHYREPAVKDSPSHSQAQDPTGRFQSVYEFKLDRGALFSARSSGLRAVDSNEEGFILFMSHGFDLFESFKPVEKFTPVLSFCPICHSSSVLQSVMSFHPHFDPVSNRLVEAGLVDTTPAEESRKVIAWKQTQDDWKLLLQLWQLGPESSTR